MTGAWVPSPHVPADVPSFLRPLAERAAAGGRLVCPSRVPGAGIAPDVPQDQPPRSAVLLLIAGTDLATARVLIHERGHALRSQPGQMALPGGRIEPTDAGPVAAALREAAEEVRLRSEDVTVLGAFEPMPMPVRGQRIVPVLAWAPEVPAVGIGDPVEVERISWLTLTGRPSLSDSAHIRPGQLDGRPVGPLFDLPGGDTVWGFTACILQGMLEGLGLPVRPADPAPQEIPQHLRW